MMMMLMMMIIINHEELRCRWQVVVANMNAMTRDTDDPKLASGSEVEPPPQSQLWKKAGKSLKAPVANGA